MKKHLLPLTLAIAAHASAATYSYTGPDYDTTQNAAAPCATPSCANYTTNPPMRQTGQFTTNQALAGSQVNADISGLITSYSFSDGITQYTSGGTGSRLVAANVYTDVAGNITSIALTLQKWQTPGAVHGVNDRVDEMQVDIQSRHNLQCGTLGALDTCAASTVDPSTSVASHSQLAGQWSLATAAAAQPVPVDNPVALGLAALGVLGLVRRRQTAAKSVAARAC